MSEPTTSKAVAFFIIAPAVLIAAGLHAIQTYEGCINLFGGCS